MKTFYLYIIIIHCLVFSFSSLTLEERWDHLINRYDYKIREGCDNHDLHCVPVSRTFHIDNVDSATMCCIPKCEYLVFRGLFENPLDSRIARFCDFSENIGIGFFDAKTFFILNHE